jgi:hypothetical protein
MSGPPLAPGCRRFQTSFSVLYCSFQFSFHAFHSALATLRLSLLASLIAWNSCSRDSSSRFRASCRAWPDGVRRLGRDAAVGASR